MRPPSKGSVFYFQFGRTLWPLRWSHFGRQQCTRQCGRNRRVPPGNSVLWPRLRLSLRCGTWRRQCGDQKLHIWTRTVGVPARKKRFNDLTEFIGVFGKGWCARCGDLLGNSVLKFFFLNRWFCIYHSKKFWSTWYKTRGDILEALVNLKTLFFNPIAEKCIWTSCDTKLWRDLYELYDYEYVIPIDFKK